MLSGPVPRDGGPLVFVDDLDRPEPSDDDRHHLERVVRLRAGDTLICADGNGGWRPGRWNAAATVEATGDVAVEPEPTHRLGVGFVVVKGNRAELVVQKLTEAGIDDMAPLHSERSMVRWDDAKAARQLERLTRVAREAAAQCRRARLPVIHTLRTPAEMVATAADSDLTLGLAEPGGGPPDTGLDWVLVGPEGGWSPSEASLVGRHVSLGPHIYRAETAAIAAGVLLGALRAGVVDARPWVESPG
jgi:16S rRNA (uracil1498-N3)-methyltransferase